MTLAWPREGWGGEVERRKGVPSIGSRASLRPPGAEPGGRGHFIGPGRPL